jgi:hypothetical protein
MSVVYHYLSRDPDPLVEWLAADMKIQQLKRRTEREIQLLRWRMEELEPLIEFW